MGDYSIGPDTAEFENGRPTISGIDGDGARVYYSDDDMPAVNFVFDFDGSPTNNEHREPPYSGDPCREGGRLTQEPQSRGASDWERSLNAVSEREGVGGDDIDDCGSDASETSLEEGEVSQHELMRLTYDAQQQSTHARFPSVTHAKQRKQKHKQGADQWESHVNGQAVPPWLAGRRQRGGERPFSAYIMLDEEVEAFAQYISPTPEEHQLRQWVVLKLHRSLEQLFSAEEGLNAEAEVFGSFHTMLYLPTSDIDVTVVVRDRVTGQIVEDIDTASVLYRVADVLRQSKFSRSCTVIATAQIPIIKAKEAVTDLAVDISINGVSGLGSANLVRRYVDDTYSGSMRPLTLVVKQLLLQHGLNEVYKGGLGSYAVVLLLVSLLQMHPACRSGEIDPARDLGLLLCAFLDLYGRRFNYRDVGISVAGKGCYYDKREEGFFIEQQPSLLSIEDPYDGAGDVTRKTFEIEKIKTLFSEALSSLRSAMDAHTYPHEDRPAQRASDKASAPTSLLASILEIPISTLKLRKQMKEIFNSKRFQSMLGLSPIPAVLDSFGSAYTKKVLENYDKRNSQSNDKRASHGRHHHALPPYLAGQDENMSDINPAHSDVAKQRQKKKKKQHQQQQEAVRRSYSQYSSITPARLPRSRPGSTSWGGSTTSLRGAPSTDAANAVATTAGATGNTSAGNTSATGHNTNTRDSNPHPQLPGSPGMPILAPQVQSLPVIHPQLLAQSQQWLRERQGQGPQSQQLAQPNMAWLAGAAAAFATMWSMGVTQNGGVANGPPNRPTTNRQQSHTKKAIEKHQ